MELIAELRALATKKHEHIQYIQRPENAEGWFSTYPVEALEADLRELLLLETAVLELQRQEALLNNPELYDFSEGTKLEALHQRERWGSSHDGGKTPFDWFWLIGYLAQKAAAAHVAGDLDKALHHCISTAAACANWHAAVAGTYTNMRPGIEAPQQECDHVWSGAHMPPGVEYCGKCQATR